MYLLSLDDELLPGNGWDVLKQKSSGAKSVGDRARC